MIIDHMLSHGDNAESFVTIKSGLTSDKVSQLLRENPVFGTQKSIIQCHCARSRTLHRCQTKSFRRRLCACVYTYTTLLCHVTFLTNLNEKGETSATVTNKGPEKGG